MSAERAWEPDVLPGFECCSLPVATPPLDCEPSDALTATLVRASRRPSTRRAVLYVHGWNDYFFQTHVADGFAERGFAFFAIDLHRYGRSRREGQLPGYAASITEYFDELDDALAVVTEDFPEVLLMGHSTGGLIASLWADARPGRFAGVLLNSPWIDLQAPSALAPVLEVGMRAMMRRDPTAIVPLPEPAGDFYARALHAEYGGEWNYDRSWKTPGDPVRAGWLAAILAGHRAVAKGLSIDCPVFMATSQRSVVLRRWSPKARDHDIVLDVDRLAAAAWKLGPVVTLVRIDGGVHDLFLSAPEVRAELWRQIDAWLAGLDKAAATASDT